MRTIAGVSSMAASPEPQRGGGAPGGGPGFRPLPEQDERGVDLSLIRENLRHTPAERLRRADRAWRDMLRLREYGRVHRKEPA